MERARDRSRHVADRSPAASSSEVKCTERRKPAPGPRERHGRPRAGTSPRSVQRRLGGCRHLYCTSSDTGCVQFPSPVLVTGRYRNCTVVPAVSPVTVVFACSVTGAVTQVLPPSVLYSHSYEARCPADAAMSFAEPVTAAGFAAKTRGERTTVFFTSTPA